jgi:hypothetical protein
LEEPLIPTPIQHALAALRKAEVPSLLIGGQACILYGGAEFSRDLDVMIAAAPADIGRVPHALDLLEAHPIAVPPFDAELLDRGHAVHFRCARADLGGLRLDLMTRPPRLVDVAAVWERHVVFDLDFGPVPAVALEDLVLTKKTQRDKDWATIGELVEADMVAHRMQVDEHRLNFWLREARNADTLIALAAAYPETASAAATQRPLLGAALEGDAAALETQLAREQIEGKAADREYWAPIRQELESMRQELRRRESP